MFRMQANIASMEGSVNASAPIPVVPTKDLNSIKDSVRRLDNLENEF